MLSIAFIAAATVDLVVTLLRRVYEQQRHAINENKFRIVEVLSLLLNDQ